MENQTKSYTLKVKSEDFSLTPQQRNFYKFYCNGGELKGEKFKKKNLVRSAQAAYDISDPDVAAFKGTFDLEKLHAILALSFKKEHSKISTVNIGKLNLDVK